MGVTRLTDVGFGGLLHLVGKTLREEGEAVALEPLPERWVDLIHHLDEQERRRANAQGKPPNGSEVAAPEMLLVLDEDLRQLAEEGGPACAEAQALVQLKSQRAQDLQVHCYRVGDIYLTGPLADATEPASADWLLLEALRRDPKE